MNVQLRKTLDRWRYTLGAIGCWYLGHRKEFKLWNDTWYCDRCDKAINWRR